MGYAAVVFAIFSIEAAGVAHWFCVGGAIVCVLLHRAFE